jgi:glycosyltransferase involved in cell wall biosynthesis
VTAASLGGRAVCVDARYLKRPGVGISWYLRQAICDLADAGAALTLLTDEPAHGTEIRTAFPAADVVTLPGHSGFVWEQRTVRRHLAASDYHAYIAPANFGLPAGYRGRTQLVVIVHDLIPLRLPQLYMLRRPAWAAKYLLSLTIAAARADHVVAVSDATARDVARLLRRQAEVVYPRIPLPGANLHQGGTGDPQTRPYVVYNGGTDVRKNVPVLLRAFSRARRELGGAELVLLGSGYEGFTPLITELGITDHVRMPGYVDEQAKTAILRGALVLLYPSMMEGFGLPVVEALAAGIPVISGTGGALREVGGAAATYVQPVTADSLAAAMVAVCNQDARQRARRAGEVQLRLLSERRESSTLPGAVARWTGRLARSSHWPC